MSGSLYEIDLLEKRVRRLYGLLPARERQGQDEEWKQYVDLFPNEPKIGSPLIIVWRYEGIIAQSTKTSLVKEIIKEKDMS